MEVPQFETLNISDKIHEKLVSIYETFEIALDQKGLISQLFNNLTEIMGAKQALFFLIKGKEGGIVLKPFANYSIKFQKGIFLSNKDPIYRVFQLRESPVIYTDNCNKNLQQSVLFRSFPNNFDCRFILLLSTSETLRGIMVFGNIPVNFNFAPEIEMLLGEIGNQAGKAIEQIALQFKIRRVAKEKSVLLEIGKKISASLDINKVLDTIIDCLKEVVPYDAAVIFLINSKSGKIEQEVYRGYHADFIKNIRLKIGQGLSGWVAKKGLPVLVPDVRKDSRYVVSHPGTLSEMAVPLRRGKKIMGVFNVESKKLNAYTKRELELLKAFANQASIAIENAQLYREALQKREFDKELQVAREIQKALLPKALPNVKGFSFSALNIPSKQVGGDFYDVTQLADGTIGLALGDVSGKGTPGAILMGNLSATYRGQIRRDLAPSVLLERVNRLFKENIASESFATFFHGKLDPKTKQFEYCNAGHNPPILLRKNGSVEFLKKGGIILGFLAKVKYQKGTITMEPGDILLMYTDGITEAENQKEQLFGIKRLVKVLKDNSEYRPSTLKWKIFREVKRFLKGSPLQDDVTMLIVRVS
jgi:sigma-B regulation protein RsbU (phosphoserine phosphatase)